MKVTISPDFRDLLPDLTAEESAQLEKNTLADSEHVNMQPIVVWGNHNNTVVDGHHQLHFREKHRLKIRYVKLDFETRGEAMLYALNIQFGRRNLDPSQRAIAFSKLPRVSSGRPAKDDESGNSANLRSFSVEELAEKAGVSTRTMESAVKVADDGAAAIVRAVTAGDVTVSDAAAIVGRPKAEQVAALKRVESGEAATLKAAIGFYPRPFEEPTTEERMKQWNRSVEFFARSISAMMANAPKGGWWDESHANIVDQQLKSLTGSIRQAKCDNLCPKCDTTGCKWCKKTGFMPRRSYEMAGGV